MKIHNIDQRSDEWKALRLGRFGSTDAQAVATAGKGLETLAYTKAAERLSGKAEENYTNADMERGAEQEELARASYEIQTSKAVTTVGYIELDEFTGGSPDGLMGDDGIIEIKCMRMAGYLKAKHTKKIDSKYLYQIQHLLYITDRQQADFIVFNENFPDVVIIPVKRDEAKIEKIKIGLEKGIELVNKIISEVNNGK